MINSRSESLGSSGEVSEVIFNEAAHVEPSASQFGDKAEKAVATVAKKAGQAAFAVGHKAETLAHSAVKKINGQTFRTGEDQSFQVPGLKQKLRNAPMTKKLEDSSLTARGQASQGNLPEYVLGTVYHAVTNKQKAAHEAVNKANILAGTHVARGLSGLARAAVFLVTSPLRLIEKGIGLVTTGNTNAHISDAIMEATGLAVEFVARLAFTVIEGLAHLAIAIVGQGLAISATVLTAVGAGLGALGIGAFIGAKSVGGKAIDGAKFVGGKVADGTKAAANFIDDIGVENPIKSPFFLKSHRQPIEVSESEQSNNDASAVEEDEPAVVIDVDVHSLSNDSQDGSISGSYASLSND